MVLGKLSVPGWLVGCFAPPDHPLQCRGTLLILVIVGQGPALAVGTGGGCLDIFSPVGLLSSLLPLAWETARYSLKNCLKGPLNQKKK